MYVTGPAHLAGTTCLLLFLWWSIAYTVKYVLTFFSLLAELGMAMIIVVGQQFKQNIVVIVIWIMLFGLLKGISLGRLAHRSMMDVITSPAVSGHQECSICLNFNCNVMLTKCRHYFHQSCLDQWRKQRSNCPNCRTQLPPSKPDLSWKFVKIFMSKCPYSTMVIGATWLYLTLR